MKARSKYQKHVVNVARREYATEEVEIDANPRISPADGGTWVAAWVWVSDPVAEAHAD